MIIKKSEYLIKSLKGRGFFSNLSIHTITNDSTLKKIWKHSMIFFAIYSKIIYRWVDCNIKNNTISKTIFHSISYLLSWRIIQISPALCLIVNLKVYQVLYHYQYDYDPLKMKNIFFLFLFQFTSTIHDIYFHMHNPNTSIWLDNKELC